MASQDYYLRIIADLKKYQSEFAKIPGYTDKKAATAAAALERRLAKAQTASAALAKKAASDSAKAWSGSMFSTFTDLKSAFDTLGSIGGKVVEQINAVQEYRISIDQLSTRTGVATEVLGGLNVAAENAGISLDEITGSLSDFPKRIDEMARGTGEAKVAFDRLGISARNTDGSIRDSNEVFKETVAKLQGIGDAGQKAALANIAFGEAGGKLMAVLGDRSLDDFVEYSRKFGIDVGPEAIKRSKEWTAATAELKRVFEGTGAMIVDELDLTGTIRNFTLGFVYMRELVSGFFGDWMEGIKATADGMRSLVTLDFAAMGPAFERYKAAMADAIDPSQEFADAKKVAETFWAGRGLLGDDAGDGKSGPLFGDPDKQKKTAITALQDVWYEQENKMAQATRDFQKAQQNVIDLAKQAGIALDDVLVTDALLALEVGFKKTTDQIIRDDIARIGGAIMDVFKSIDQLTSQLFENSTNKRKENISDLEEQLKRAEEAGDTMRMRSIENEIKAEKDKLRKVAAAQKAMAITNAILQGTLSTIAALQYGPAYAIVAGVTAAAGIAAIAATPPPKFHRGGMIQPDEVDIRAQRGEFVMSKQGVAAYGEQALRDMNAGMGGDRPLVIQQVYEHRVLGEVIRDHLKLDTPLRRAVRSDRTYGKNRTNVTKHKGGL